VAIKVVRKFEMNSNQVSIGWKESLFLSHTHTLSLSHAPIHLFFEPFANMSAALREMLTFTRISRSSPRLSRCAYIFIIMGDSVMTAQCCNAPQGQPRFWVVFVLMLTIDCRSERIS
jgi:hypothetical protein